MTRRTIAAGFAAVALAQGAAVAAADALGVIGDAPRVDVAHVSPDVRAKIHGCPAEDSCIADYRGEPDGSGVWIIRRWARH